MNYELTIFERIIGGDLSPFADGLDDPLKYNHAIKLKHNSCFNFVIACFRKSQNKLVLTDKKVMSSMHPLVNKLITPQQNLFQVADIENIAPNAFKLLGIKKQNIVHISYSKQPNKICIYIKEVRNCSEINPQEAKFYYYNDILKEAVDSIKQNIKKSVFQFQDSVHIEHYIHKIQQAVINLRFQILKLIEPKREGDIYKLTTDFNDIDIFSLTYTYLEDLLCFIEKHYLKYIDENIQIPYRSELLETYGITEKLDIVKPLLLNSNIDTQLMKIIFVPFLKLSAITLEERISYKELIYLNVYLMAFYEKITDDFVFTEESVLQLIIDLNYNTIEMFNVFINKIIQASNAYESIHEKLDFLFHYLKIVNQKHCRTKLFYNSNLPSLKYQIIGWIEEEINYLTKKTQLQSQQQQPNLFTQLEKTKIQSGLSVAQLAYFFKLQVDAGIITQKNQSDIFRHITDNYQTSKVHEISLDSVKNKFYNIEQSTIDVIKDKIIDILNQLKSH